MALVITLHDITTIFWSDMALVIILHDITTIF